jgi:O-antigen ligase
MLYVLIVLSVLFAVRALVGWRAGIALMVLLAAVQDPLRKFVPETPGWLALATVPIFFAALISSCLKTRHWWADFSTTYPSISASMLTLAVLCLPAAVISLGYGEGAWMLVLIGAFSYAVIFLAVIAGFHYARNLTEMRKLLGWYCIVHGVALTGGIMDYLHRFPEWDALGSRALGFEWVRRNAGYSVDMIAGFYRSPDVMGWHAAAVSMISLLLAATARGRRRVGWSLVGMLAVAALLLCGRRKMVYMLPIFMIALAWIYWQAGRAGRVLPILGLVLLPLATAWLVGDKLSEESSNIRYYSESSNEALDRLEVHGFASLVETYKQTGFFGAGLGVATPGARHLNVKRPRAWQESGTSRVLVELGVPGALGMFAVMAAIVFNLWRATLRQLHLRSLVAPYAVGLLAFFLANVGSLVVSGQILADPFIAAFLGLLVGMNLSVVRLAGSSTRTVAAPPQVPASAHPAAARIQY